MSSLFLFTHSQKPRCETPVNGGSVIPTSPPVEDCSHTDYFLLLLSPHNSSSASFKTACKCCDNTPPPLCVMVKCSQSLFLAYRVSKICSHLAACSISVHDSGILGPSTCGSAICFMVHLGQCGTSKRHGSLHQEVFRVVHGASCNHLCSQLFIYESKVFTYEP